MVTIAASSMTITTLWCGLKHYSAWKTQQQKAELPSGKLLLLKQVAPWRVTLKWVVDRSQDIEIESHRTFNSSLVGVEFSIWTVVCTKLLIGPNYRGLDDKQQRTKLQRTSWQTVEDQTRGLHTLLVASVRVSVPMTWDCTMYGFSRCCHWDKLSGGFMRFLYYIYYCL